MLWMKDKVFKENEFKTEKELEDAILECQSELFGKHRYYFDIKKLIGKKGKTRNIPDGYLLDLSDCDYPILYVVENELSKHHTLKHIAVQILEFSLSFPSSKNKIKKILREEIKKDQRLSKEIGAFSKKHDYDNVDHLLDSILYDEDAFNVLLIIDKYSEELEDILQNKFNFIVEVLTLSRYKSSNNEIVYDFTPMDEEELEATLIQHDFESDTLVVPAREEGFNDVFLGEDCWYSVRINKKMIPKIKYIAAYQVSPISAITHIAKVESIKRYENTDKYILYFEEPAEEIEHVGLGHNSRKAPQSSRYTNMERLINADSIDDIF